MRACSGACHPLYEDLTVKFNTTHLFTLCLMALTLSVGSAYAASEKQRAEIEERIRKTGQVCLDTDSDCGASGAVASVARSGEEVYNAACMACHMTGAAGAPVPGTDAWAERVAKGADVLVANAINGIGIMP